MDPEGLCAVKRGWNEMQNQVDEAFSFLTKGQRRALLKTGLGVVTIAGGTFTGNVPMIVVGIAFTTEGGILSLIEFGFHGDTSQIPSPWIILNDLGKGIVKSWPTGKWPQKVDGKWKKY